MVRKHPPYLPDANVAAATFCYPAGSMLRVKQICGTQHRPGIVPIHASTWYDNVARGLIPRGTKLGPKTTAWPIEVVLAVARGEYVKSQSVSAPPVGDGELAPSGVVTS